MLKILLDTIIVVALVGTSVYLYRTYGDDIRALFGGDDAVIFIDTLALRVTIADTPEARRKGLSNTRKLGELEGMLFIFETGDYPRMWMKDMQYPIAIFFINEQFEVVEIAENVLPESYPLTYTSEEPARFVLETNANLARSFKIEVGDTVTIPPRNLPQDLRRDLLDQ